MDCNSSLTSLTEQQEAVVDAVVRRAYPNVVVNAKAGSGKTTLALALSQALVEKDPEARVLLLTYNRRLRLETSERVARRDLDHAVAVHNFHTAAVTYFEHCEPGLDQGVRQALFQFPDCFPHFPVVIMDEAQDLCDLYADFLRHVLKLCRARQVVVMGDPFQTLYEYHGARTAYITHPGRHGLHAPGTSDRPFLTLGLDISFRCPPQVCQYVNEALNPGVLLKWPGFVADGGDDAVRMWGRGIQPFNAPSARPGLVDANLGVADVGRVVRSAYRRGLSVAVLSYSLNNCSLRAVVNRTHSVPWLSVNDDKAFDYTPAIRHRKVVASTIHQSKGMEFDVVVLIGMDNYFERKYHAKNPLPMQRVYYVACTRAKQELYIVRPTKESEQFATIRGTPFVKCSFYDEDDGRRETYGMTRVAHTAPNAEDVHEYIRCAVAGPPGDDNVNDPDYEPSDTDSDTNSDVGAPPPPEENEDEDEGRVPRDLVEMRGVFEDTYEPTAHYLPGVVEEFCWSARDVSVRSLAGVMRCAIAKAPNGLTHHEAQLGPVLLSRLSTEAVQCVRKLVTNARAALARDLEADYLKRLRRDKTYEYSARCGNRLKVIVPMLATLPDRFVVYEIVPWSPVPFAATLRARVAASVVEQRSARPTEARVICAETGEVRRVDLTCDDREFLDRVVQVAASQE